MVCRDSLGNPGKPWFGVGKCVWYYGVLVFKESNYLFLRKTQYEGQWVDAKMDGYGIYITVNGNKYIGQWKQNKREGRGEFLLTDGLSFKGYWVNDKLTCNDGYIQYNELKNLVQNKIVDYAQNSQQFSKSVQEYLASGISYEGSISDGKINGNGIITLRSRKFSGTFYGGIPISGTVTLSDGRSITIESFHDEWKSSKRVAIISFRDGTLLELHTDPNQPFQYDFKDGQNNTSDILEKYGLNALNADELKITLSSLFFFEYYLTIRGLYLSSEIYPFSDENIKQITPEELSKYEL